MTEPTAIVLTVESGPCLGTTAVLRTAQGILGRDTDCALCLENDSTVSRRHASLSWEGGQWLLRDHASKNGTFLAHAGAPVPLEGPRVVTPGEKFILGSALVAISRPRPPEIEAAQLRIGLVGNDLDLQLESGAALAARATRPYAAAQIDALHRKLHALLATAEATGASIDASFLDLGRQLAEATLPVDIRDHVKGLGKQPLTLILDPALIGIAWEAICLNSLPICLERPISRRILIENSVPRPRTSGKRFLVIANPTGDLPEAQQHGETLLELLTVDHALSQVSFLAGRRATLQNVATALTNCDVVVYLGHAEHVPGSGGGWCLADGLLDVARIATLAQVPALIIAAACESARESPSSEQPRLLPEGTGIASAFLLAGAQQYIGTLWRVPVVSGTAFAAVLLRGIVGGDRLGDAVLRARTHLHTVLRAPAHACAAYVHYGAHSWTLQDGPM